MSMRDCISAKMAAGKADPERARAAIELFDELEAEFRGSLGPGEAARQAGRETVRIIKREALERKRRELLQVQAWKRIDRETRGYRTARGEEDPGAAFLALLDHDDRASYSNVQARYRAVRARLLGRMENVLHHFRRNAVTVMRNKADTKNLVRELFGENTGDVSARELAKAFTETAEHARRKFNAGGGRIGKRADWGMPQLHDTLRVRKVTFEAWRNFIAPRLDTARMIDAATGLPFTKGRLEFALRDVYETIRTDGFDKLRPSGVSAGTSLANRRADHRFLVFKNADGWMEYQERFGAGSNPIDVMVSHLDHMSRDIAMMEILGPNPEATMTRLSQVVEKHGAMRDATGGKTKYGDRARTQVKRARDMYSILAGTTNAPINSFIARGVAGLRSGLYSALLGRAALSAVSDMGYRRVAAKMAGLPQVETLARFVKTFAPGSEADRRFAARHALIAEHEAQAAIALARFGGEVTGPEFMRRVADTVMSVTLLNRWTNTGRESWGLQFAGSLADYAKTPFDALTPEFRGTLRRYGIGPRTWDIIRATTPTEHRGSTFLTADDIAGRTDLPPGVADALATRVLEMIHTEGEFAVPSATLRGRAAWLSDQQPGTFQGELLRSVAMFKNFATTVLMTHVRRGLSQPGTISKGRYLAEVVISTTFLGALVIVMKDIGMGRDPRPMNTAEFWEAALLQGGGLGIYGDFLFSEKSRMDRGLPETLAGPVVGFAADTLRLTAGNVIEASEGKDTRVGREIVDYLRRYTPGGSIWYLNLAIDRLILDQLQLMADPAAYRAFHDRERRWHREFHQDHWWRPGHVAPDRAPNWGNVWR